MKLQTFIEQQNPYWQAEWRHLTEKANTLRCRILPDQGRQTDMKIGQCKQTARPSGLNNQGNKDDVYTINRD